MEPHRKGDLTEAIVVAELKRRGIPVAKPVGDNERYDLVAESDAALWRLQVKTGRLREGTIRFDGTSTYTNAEGNTRKRYEGDTDYFVVYVHESEDLYLLSESAFDTRMRLRVEEPEQADTSINWAREYEFDRNWPPEDGVASPTTLDDEILGAVTGHDVRVWLPVDDAEGYDALVEAGDGVRTVRFERGWVVDGRVRFDTGDADESAAEREAVDDVLVYCAEREELYAIARDAYGETVSFRVVEPQKPDSRINRAEEYRFAENWPTQTDS